MTPLDAMEAMESRLWDVHAAGANPWTAGAKLIAGRMGLSLELALDGVIETQAAFGRVVQSEDPRRFRVASDAQRAAATPAMMLFCAGEGEAGDDVLALSLKDGARRFWRMTCGCDWLGDLKPDSSGTLRLRQDAHAYVGAALKSAAYQRRGRDEARSALERGLLHARRESGLESFAEALKLPGDDAARLTYVRMFQGALRSQSAARDLWRLAGAWPTGALILDPLPMQWTRRGVLGDAEWIEIVDAPADGPLGRAIRKLNPKIGTPHGVRLVGQAPTATKYQGRAA